MQEPRKSTLLFVQDAAAEPAALGPATATQLATSMQAGRRKTPRRPSGLTQELTSCTSQRVIEIAAAKPMDEQIDMMSDPRVMLFAKALSAAIGSSESVAIRRPEAKSTRRVSQRFRRAAIVSSVTMTAIQSVKVVMGGSLG